jgi:hypothetical protein
MFDMSCHKFAQKTLVKIQNHGQTLDLHKGWFTAYSFGWLLVAGADLFWDKSTAGWLLVAGLFWDKSTIDWWLISQAIRALVFLRVLQIHYRSSKPTNMKVIRYFREHIFRNWRTFQFWVQINQKQIWNPYEQ